MDGGEGGGEQTRKRLHFWARHRGVGEGEQRPHGEWRLALLGSRHALWLHKKTLPVPTAAEFQRHSYWE